MRRRTIRQLATFNVITASVLYVWFMAMPRPSAALVQAQAAAYQMADVDPEIRLEFTRLFHETWQRSTTHYSWWAMAAGVVVLANTGVFFCHLLAAESCEDRASTGPNTSAQNDAADG